MFDVTPADLDLSEPGVVVAHVAESERRRLREEATQLGGTSTLLHYTDAGDAGIDITKAHPGSLPQFITGRPTLLSNLFRDEVALRTARLAAERIAAKDVELRTSRGLDTVHLAVAIAAWRIGGVSYAAPVLLRPGAISREQIAAVCGMQPLSKEELPALTPRASGTLEAHYAPAAKVRLMDAKALQTALDLLGADAAHIAVYARSALRTRSSKLVVRRMPDDASATAQQLFAVLRGFDDQAVKLIWIETPPASPDWEGVSDRLQRAAAA